MEEVLKLAGYHPSRIKNWQAVVLEPAFWQALGKALNWSGWMCRNCRLGKVLKICGCNNAEAFLIKPWLYYALRFFELRMTGGDEEKFWKELINPPSK